MITNQSYWLQMINIELSGALTFIKHQMNIFQVLNQEFLSLCEFLYSLRKLEITIQRSSI